MRMHRGFLCLSVLLIPEVSSRAEHLDTIATRSLGVNGVWGEREKAPAQAQATHCAAQAYCPRGFEVGRASCRERVCEKVYISGVGAVLNKKLERNTMKTTTQIKS